VGDVVIIRNGLLVPLNGLVPAGWWVDETKDLNNHGAILAMATPTVDANGDPIDEENWASEQVLLLPIVVTWEAANAGGALSDNRTPALTDGENHPLKLNLYGEVVDAGGWMPGKGQRVFPDAWYPGDPAEHNTVTLRVHVGPAAVGMQVHVRALDVDDPTPLNFDNDGITFGDRSKYLITPQEGEEIHDVFGRPYDNGNVHIIDPNDFNPAGKDVPRGDDNRLDPLDTAQTGRFVANMTTLVDEEWPNYASGVVNADGNADFVFTVGIQPGNNYRVAVVVTPANATASISLADLQVANATATSYVSWDSDQQVPAAEFGGVLSPLLTVWRKLHVEQDSMPAPSDDHTNNPQRNFETGTIVDAPASVAGSSPAQYKFHLDVDLSGGNNRFEGGRILIADKLYDVVRNENRVFGGDEITILDDPANPITAISGGAAGKAFYLTDDDGRYLDPGVNDLPRTDLVTDAVRAKFVPAYIEVDTAVANATVSVPFILNVPADQNTDLNKNVPTSDAYWACRVIAAFQQAVVEDGDPMGEGLTDGGTRRHSGDSYIYLETIREPFKDALIVTHPTNQFDVDGRTNALQRLPMRREEIVAHEIGHNPQNDLTHDIVHGSFVTTPDHAENGLMSEGADAGDGAVRASFSPLTIHRFRESKKWAD
jgi:hypothetical protein